MRTLAIIGSRLPRRAADLVFRCSWCGWFRTNEDAERAATGTPISHGICPKCAAELEQQQVAS